MFCVRCGKKLEDDAKFCAYCGGKVDIGEVIPSSESAISNNVEATAVTTQEPERVPRKILVKDEPEVPAEQKTSCLEISMLNEAERGIRSQDITLTQTEQLAEQGIDFKQEPILGKKKYKKLTYGILGGAAFLAVLAVVLIGFLVGKARGGDIQFICAQDNEYVFLNSLKERADTIDLAAVYQKDGSHQYYDDALKFSEDGKYAYFISKIDNQDCGTLNQVEVGKLKVGSGKNDSYIEKVASNVPESDWHLFGDNKILYASDVDRSSSAYVTSKLSWYNGKTTEQIDKGVINFYLSKKENAVLYTCKKEGSVGLYYCLLDGKSQPEKIASEIGQPYINYYNDDISEVLFIKYEKSNEADLFLTPSVYVGGIGRSTERLLSGIDELKGWTSAEDFYYTAKGTKKISYSTLVNDDCSSQDLQISEPQLNNYIVDDGWWSSYNYNAYHKDYDAYEAVQARLHLWNMLQIMTYTKEGDSLYHYVNGESTLLVKNVENVDVLSPQDGIVLYNKVKEIDEKLNLSQIESMQDVEKFLSEHSGCDESTTYCVIGAGTPTKIDGLIKNGVYNATSKTMVLFDQENEQDANDLKAFLGHITDGRLMLNLTTARKIINTLVYDKDIYFYEAMEDSEYADLKAYDGVEIQTLAKDVDPRLAEIYSDGTILTYSDFEQGSGGTLVQIKGSEITRVGDDISSFYRIDDKTMLFISDSDLYLYRNGKKVRLQSDVYRVWGPTFMDASILS